MKILNIPLRSQ